jgi:hypothetical protein
MNTSAYEIIGMDSTKGMAEISFMGMSYLSPFLNHSTPSMHFSTAQILIQLYLLNFRE